MEEIAFWRLCDELSIIQAALLIVGEDPTPYEVDVENQTSNSQPRRYNAAKNAILKAVKSGSLEDELVEVHADINSDSYICLHSSTVIVEA